MGSLLRNIWEAPAATASAGLVAAIGVITAADLPVHDGWIVGLSAAAAFLALFSGPNTPS